jgi:hypothetical protein
LYFLYLLFFVEQELRGFLGAKAARFYRARPGAKLQALQGACGSLAFAPKRAPSGRVTLI